MSITPRQYIPLPYQPQMLEHLERTPKALLLVEMGLGKSVVVLKRISDMILNGESNGCLICCPLRVKLLTWPDQCETWEHSAWLRVVDMSTPEGEQAWNEGSADIYLIHYDVLATREVTRKVKGKTVKRTYPGFVDKFLKGRKKIPINMVVYDEISVFKDPNGKRAAAMRTYHELMPFRVGLSGTPLGNSRLNLFNQVRMIDDGERLGRSFTQFRQWAAESDYMGYTWKMREGMAEKIDEKIADISLVLLCEDHAQLPPCYTEDIEVTLPPAAEKDYKKMEKELLLELEKGDIVSLNAAVLSNKLLQIGSGACYGEDREVHIIHDAKLDALKKLRKKLGPKEPLIVLVSFKHERERILQAIPGSRNFDVKDMDAWRQGKIHTFVADARSIGHGIDSLQTSCCNMVFYTPYWSSEVTKQVIKRIWRRGNFRDTYIWRLVCKIKGKITMDEIVIESNRTYADEQSAMFRSLQRLRKLLNK